jgi:transposase-like protein
MRKAVRKEKEAALRAQLLLDVMAGRKTSSEAAETLGISRKSWHSWQKAGLNALLQSMTHGEPGRPRKPAVDPELQKLRKTSAEQVKRIRQLECSVMILKASSGLTGLKVKKRSKKKGRKKPCNASSK